MDPMEKESGIKLGVWGRLVVWSILLSLCGCQTGEPSTAANGDAALEAQEDALHKEHPHTSATAPLSLADALKKVEEAQEEICKAFEQGTPEDAHDALHQVGHVLEQLPQLATQGRELSSETVTELNQAVESLFDGFGKLDDTLQGGAEVDLEQIRQQLTAGIAIVRKVLP